MASRSSAQTFNGQPAINASIPFNSLTHQHGVDTRLALTVSRPQMQEAYGAKDFTNANGPTYTPGQAVARRYKHLLDRTTPHVYGRWLALAGFVCIYALRVLYVKGFYIITYALGIYNLNLLLGFLTPQIDPEMEGPTLPSQREDEFRPFVRRLPEFKFWYSSAKAFLLGFALTFFPIFDVPVFWPILLLYWFVLFFITMKRQIKHMIKYKYIPFSTGKKQYKGKPTAAQKNSK